MKCHREHDFSRYAGAGESQLVFDDADKCNRCGCPRSEVQSPEYMMALHELRTITVRIIGCGPDDHQWKYVGARDDSGLDWWRCKLCDTYEQEVELERDSILAPRQWKTPTGAIHAEAYNDYAVDLLLNDPEEYFRLRSMELKRVGIL